MSNAGYGSSYSPAEKGGEDTSTDERKKEKKRMKRISSLVGIRNLLNLGGVAGLGGKRGPVVVPPNDDGNVKTGVEFEKNLNSNEAAMSKDPLVKMRRER